MTHFTLTLRSALVAAATSIAIPDAHGQDLDVDAEALRAVSQTETNHRSRMARIARLREIANRQSDTRRLRELDRLESTQRALYEGQIEWVKKEHGRVAVRRVSDHLGLSGKGGGSNPLVRTSTGTSRSSTPRTADPSPRATPQNTPVDAVPRNVPGDAVPRNTGPMTVPPNAGPDSTVSIPRPEQLPNQTGSSDNNVRTKPEYVAPQRGDNRELREKVQKKKARQKRRDDRAKNDRVGTNRDGNNNQARGMDQRRTGGGTLKESDRAKNDRKKDGR